MNTMTPAIFLVKRVRKETADTWTLALEPKESNGGFRYAAGQFNMLYAFGIGEAPISISGNPDGPVPLLHTIRAVGPVTEALVRLKPGAELGVRGPFGSFWPVEPAQGKDVVIVAGGIGLAPLRPVVYQVLAERARYGKITILYGARTPKDLLFANELKKWRGRFDVNVGLTVDNADVSWKGSVGVVTRQIPRAEFDPLYTTAMVCGPGVMMRYTITALEERGIEPQNIYVSMERNMKCGVGLCGHCQYGPEFVCKDGPVFTCAQLEDLLAVREL
jgi:NAD(P)H-flavin reductase